MSVIIVPYRNRPEHLDCFLKCIPDFQAHITDLTKIIIVEQENDGLGFNRGMLKNIGFLLSGATGLNRVFFHDIDWLPASADTIQQYYNFLEKPIVRLLSAHKATLGGVVQVSANILEKCNAFPNTIFEWGVEDRVLFYRTQVFEKNIHDVNILPEQKGFRSLAHKSHGHAYIGDLKRYSNNEHKIHTNGTYDEKITNMMCNGLSTIAYTVLKTECICEGAVKYTVRV